MPIGIVEIELNVWIWQGIFGLIMNLSMLMPMSNLIMVLSSLLSI